MPRATIQAIDEPDGTIYVLSRPGEPLVSAYWPHPLYDLAPDAIRIPATGEVPPLGIAVTVGINLEVPVNEERMAKAALKQRMKELKAWRAARPGRFSRNGRKRAHSAFVNEEQLRHIQWRHWVGYESLRSICREGWREWGYANEKSAMNAIWEAIKAYGLRTHSRAEMTARSNRARSMRLPGETKDEFRARRRRETGEIHGRICIAVKRQAPGKGKPCQHSALWDSDFCRGHDPRFEQERQDRLAELRSRRS